MIVGGLVASTADALVFLVVGPGGGVAFGRHSFIAPAPQESGGGMIDVIKSGGQVGSSSELGDKGLPGWGCTERGNRLAN